MARHLFQKSPVSKIGELPYHAGKSQEETFAIAQVSFNDQRLGGGMLLHMAAAPDLREGVRELVALILATNVDEMGENVDIFGHLQDRARDLSALLAKLPYPADGERTE